MRVNENPRFLAAYYAAASRYYFNVMVIPAALLLMLLIGLRFRQTYQLLIESVRCIQLVGLAAFLAYPMQSPVFSILQGFNYFNLEFIPNIYNMFVPTFSSITMDSRFFSFELLYGDMDFVRMIGSVLVFIAVWTLMIVTMKIFFTKNHALLGWLLRLAMDLIEVKIMHSFWNSLIFTIMSAEENNLFMLWVHFVSYAFMGLTIFRYYKIYRTTGQLDCLFTWRVLSTLLISLAVFSKMIVLIIVAFVSIGVGLREYHVLR